MLICTCLGTSIGVPWHHNEQGVPALGTRERITRVDQAIIRAHLARRHPTWKLVNDWIKPVVYSPRWCFDCDPEDVLQETHMEIYKGISTFRGESPLESWVRGVAFNTCGDHHRKGLKKKREIEIGKIEIAARNPGPLDELIRRESEGLREETLNAILANAEARCLDLWTMHYWEGMPYEEIAETLGIALGTVKSRASRCRDKARRAMGLAADG